MTAAQHGAKLVLRCDIDCTYVAELWQLPGHLLASRHGRAVGGTPTTLPLQAPQASGRYRLRLSVLAAVNRGKGSVVLLPLHRG